MRMTMAAAVLVVGLLPIGLMQAAAAATAPANDHWRHAVRVRLGDTVRQNTTRATTDRIDVRANRACGAPFTRATVWFKYRTRQTRRVVLDMSASDYSGGLMVFRGRPSVSHLKLCGPGSVTFRAREGVRYFIVAFSDTRTRGGRLVLSVAKVSPPTAEVTLDPRAILRGEAVQVTGSFRCADATFVGIDVTATQRFGHLKVVGSNTAEPDPVCDGQWRPFSTRVSSPWGIYDVGAATVSVDAVVCNDFRCATLSLPDQQVTIRSPVA
jgi:hypothetical protein